MSDKLLESLTSHKPHETDNAPLFVSIYAVLLSFFIILNTISKRDENRMEQVVDSVGKAFSMPSQYRPPVAPPKTTYLDPSTIRFFQEMEQLLSQFIRLEELQLSRTENSMTVTVAKSDLYLADSIKLRKENLDFAERIAKLLVPWIKDYAIEVRFLIGVEKNTSAAQREVDIRRAGGFVRALTAENIPGASLVAGLDESQPDRATLIFTIQGTKGDPTRFLPRAGNGENHEP